MVPGSYPHKKYVYGLYRLKHHIVEMRGDVTDAGQTNKRRQTLKIELLSRWKLEAEFRNTDRNVKLKFDQRIEKESM